MLLFSYEHLAIWQVPVGFTKKSYPLVVMRLYRCYSSLPLSPFTTGKTHCFQEWPCFTLYYTYCTIQQTETDRRLSYSRRVVPCQVCHYGFPGTKLSESFQLLTLELLALFDDGITTIKLTYLYRQFLTQILQREQCL